MSLTQLRLRKKRYNAETDNSKGVLVVDTDARSLFVGGVELIPDFDGSTADNDGKHGLVPAPLSTDKDKYLHADGTWKEVADFVGAHTESSYTIDASLDLADYVMTTDANAFHDKFPSGVVISNNTSNGMSNSVFTIMTINDRNDSAISQFGWDTNLLYGITTARTYLLQFESLRQNGTYYPFGTVDINKRTFVDWMDTLGLSTTYFVHPTYDASYFLKTYYIHFDGYTYTLYDNSNGTQLATGFALEDTGITMYSSLLTDCGFNSSEAFDIYITYQKSNYAGYTEPNTSNVYVSTYYDWDHLYSDVNLTPEQFSTLDVDWEKIYRCYFVYDSVSGKWLIYELHSYADSHLCDSVNLTSTVDIQESILHNIVGGFGINLAQYYTDNRITILPDRTLLPIPILTAVPASGGSVVVPGTHGLVPAPQPGDRDKALFGDGTWRSAGGSADFTFDPGSAVADTPNSTLTVTTSATQRTYTDYTVDNTLPSSETIQLVLDVQNNFENYLLLRNDTGATLAVTIGTPTYTGGTLTEVVSSDSGISVDDGKIIEISYIVVGTAIVITNSGAMSSASLLP